MGVSLGGMSGYGVDEDRANSLLREWYDIGNCQSGGITVDIMRRTGDYLFGQPAPQDEPARGDMAFVTHILHHLEPGEEVICKICGKTAREIMGEPIPPDPLLSECREMLREWLNLDPMEPVGNLNFTLVAQRTATLIDKLDKAVEKEER